MPRRVVIEVGAFFAGFVAIVLAGKVVFPAISNTTAVPNGLYLQGLVVGLLSALLAIGLVLIYRANRIVNFAQGALGAVAATLASQVYRVWHWPYVLAVPAGILAAVAASLAVEFFVIRRFTKAPRLILTVATIGVAQILGVIELLPTLINRDRDVQEFRASLESPLSAGFTFGHVRFRGDHLIVLLVAPAMLIGLALFFRYTRYGVAARGAAENADRARLLGVRVRRVSLVVWGLAGLLSALTAVLRAPILGFQLGSFSGQGLLMRALAAGVIGRMESLPITVGASVLITMAEQAIFFSYGRSGPTDGFLLAVVVIALVAQRKRFGRVDPGSSSWSAVHEVRPIPTELKSLPEVRVGRWGGLSLIAAFLLTMPLVLSPSNTSLASAILLYAMVGISLVILTGWSGNVSLGQWAIVGVGALLAAKLATRAEPLDFFITIAVAGTAGAVVSLVIGLPALRIRGLFLGVTTLGFALAAHNLFFQWPAFAPEGPIRRPFLFNALDVTSERGWYYVCLAGLVFAVLIGSNVRRSRLGRNLIAVRDNEVQAVSLGIRLTRSKLTAFAISGFLAAMAGGLYAYHQQSMRYDRFPAETSLLMFSMVVIGGMGSMTGAVLGALYVRGTQYFLPAEFQLLATGFGLLLLLLIFPGGLGQAFFAARDRALRTIAKRRGIVVPSLVADVLDEPPEEDLSISAALAAPALSAAGTGTRR